MLIRSQDKKELHNLDKIYMLEVIPQYGKNTNNYLVQINHTKCIGIYSTEEKAICVLDMIQNAYENSLYCDYIYAHSANVQRPYIFVENKVFQMPKEEKVK